MTMTRNEIVRRVVLDWLDTEPDYMTFVEAFPDEAFEEYMDDDRVLQEVYREALDELRTVRYVYEKHL